MSHSVVFAQTRSCRRAASACPNSASSERRTARRIVAATQRSAGRFRICSQSSPAVSASMSGERSRRLSASRVAPGSRSQARTTAASASSWASRWRRTSRPSLVAVEARRVQSGRSSRSSTTASSGSWWHQRCHATPAAAIAGPSMSARPRHFATLIVITPFRARADPCQEVGVQGMSALGMDTPRHLAAAVLAGRNLCRWDDESHDLAVQIRSDILGACPGTPCLRTPAARPG